jgi:hypothetical protein
MRDEDIRAHARERHSIGHTEMGVAAGNNSDLTVQTKEIRRKTVDALVHFDPFHARHHPQEKICAVSGAGFPRVSCWVYDNCFLLYKYSKQAQE